LVHSAEERLLNADLTRVREREMNTKARGRRRD
jgi:hypothetical protein